MRYSVCIGALAAAMVSWAGTALGDRAVARQWVAQAERALERGDEDRALSLYERAIAEDPDYLPAYDRAAPLWLRHRRSDDVIRHFERVTLRHPDHAFGWYTLAYAYRLSGRHDSAVAAYEAYIDLRPGQPAAYFGLGVANKQAGHVADAIAAYARYIELERDPDRRAYVDQARREIAALGGTPPPVRAPAERAPGPGTDARPEAIPGRERALPARRHGSGRLAEIRALLAQRRYASASALAARFRPRDDLEVIDHAIVRARILIGQARRDEARTIVSAALAAAPAHPELRALAAALSASGRDDAPKGGHEQRSGSGRSGKRSASPAASRGQ